MIPRVSAARRPAMPLPCSLSWLATHAVTSSGVSIGSPSARCAVRQSAMSSDDDDWNPAGVPRIPPLRDVVLRAVKASGVQTISGVEELEDGRWVTRRCSRRAGSSHPPRTANSRLLNAFSGALCTAFGNSASKCVCCLAAGWLFRARRGRTTGCRSMAASARTQSLSIPTKVGSSVARDQALARATRTATVQSEPGWGNSQI